MSGNIEEVKHRHLLVCKKYVTFKNFKLPVMHYYYLVK